MWVTATRLSCERRYSFRYFHTVILPVLKCTECKEIHLSSLNGIFCEINMIKLLAYTLLLCFLLSFKKILPSWTTTPGYILGQSRSDCCDNANQGAPAQSLWIEWRCEVISPCSETSPYSPSPLISAYKLHLVLCCTPVTPQIPCKLVLLHHTLSQHFPCYKFKLKDLWVLNSVCI